MIKPKPITEQESLVLIPLKRLINYKHELCQMTHQIPWEEFEGSLSKYYRQDFGRPAKSIRLMVSLLILKQLYNVSDEVVVETWSENPYWQYFSGEEYFQWHLPCDPTELTKFRRRIGTQGVEKIFEVSIKIHGKEAMEREVIADTTVQEKNITYPTDTKLHLKIIGKCLKMSQDNGINVRQSYRRTLKKLRWATRYLKNPRRAKEGYRAIRKIKTIAGRLLREVNRKLPEEIKQAHSEELSIMEQILRQQRDGKNKIYSVHEPQVSCIAKGKEHKKYEFGSKASVVITKTSGIIVGAMNFQGAPYDGHTLEPALEQVERLRGVKTEKALVDEGYKGKQMIGDTEVLRVHRPKKEKYSKYKWKQFFRRRAAVEATISHLKNNHRLDRNYLKGSVGDSINLMLSASAYNFRKFLRKLSYILRFLKYIYYDYIFRILQFK